MKDHALARRLQATFERDLEMTDVHGLHFYVQNGVVSLYGTLRHELDQDLLLTCVQRVPGVTGIDTENLNATDGSMPSGEHQVPLDDAGS